MINLASFALLPIKTVGVMRLRTYEYTCLLRAVTEDGMTADYF